MTRLARTVDDVCAEMGIGRTKAYALAKEGRLVIRKVGRRSVILDEDLQVFLRSLPAMGQAAQKPPRKPRGR